jgi:hypothetical protein
MTGRASDESASSSATLGPGQPVAAAASDAVGPDASSAAPSIAGASMAVTVPGSSSSPSSGTHGAHGLGVGRFAHHLKSLGSIEKRRVGDSPALLELEQSQPIGLGRKFAPDALGRHEKGRGEPVCLSLGLARRQTSSTPFETSTL